MKPNRKRGDEMFDNPNKTKTLLVLNPCLFKRDESDDWEPGLVANEGWLSNLGFIDQQGRTIGEVYDYYCPGDFKPIPVEEMFKALKKFADENEMLEAG